MMVQFDSHLYEDKVIANDMHYFLSRFRKEKRNFKMKVKEGHTGDFVDIAGQTIDVELMNMIPIFLIFNMEDPSEFGIFTYEQYLCIKDIKEGPMIFPEIYIMNLVDLFITVPKNTFNNLNSVGNSSIETTDKFVDFYGYQGIKFSAFISLIESGDLSFDNGVTYEDNYRTAFQKIGLSSDFISFVDFYNQGKFSDRYKLDLFPYIKPQLLNPFLYPTYVQDNKEVSIGDIIVEGGSGGSSAFTIEQAQLITKVVAKLLLSSDPFERGTDILNGAGILTSESFGGEEE